MRRVLLLAILCAAATCAVGLSSAIACTIDDLNCEVQPPSTGTVPTQGSVVTTGVIVLGPGHGPGSDGSCTNCRWMLVPACGDATPGTDSVCPRVTTTCPPGQLRFVVYVSRDGGPWELVNQICWDPTDGTDPVVDVGAIVRERVENLLPAGDPSAQPKAGAVVNLPAVFDAGQSATWRSDPFTVVGFQVVVTARATWTWQFDSDVTRDVDKRGGAWPNDDVTWTYQTAGDRSIVLTTRWTAQYTVDGQGPFDVPGPVITKTSPALDLPVRTAGSVLVSGS